MQLSDCNWYLIRAIRLDGCVRMLLSCSSLGLRLQWPELPWRFFLTDATYIWYSRATITH